MSAPKTEDIVAAWLASGGTREDFLEWIARFAEDEAALGWDSCAEASSVYPVCQDVLKSHNPYRRVQ